MNRRRRRKRCELRVLRERKKALEEEGKVKRRRRGE